MTHAGVLAWARLILTSEEVLFPSRWAQPIAKRMLRLEQHKLYLIAKKWRSKNLVCKQLLNLIQVETPKIQKGWGKREEIGKSERNIWVIQEQVCDFDLKLMQLSFSVLRRLFQLSWQLSWCWWACHLANVYSEPVIRLKAHRSQILHHLGPSWF